MKNKLNSLVIGLALLVGVYQAAAQGTQFFRISGPAATTILSFNLDGAMVWSNAQPDTTYTIQTSTTLDPNWVDYVQISVTQPINTSQLVSFNPPSGMAFIPAGSFTMGDTLDDEADAIPITVTVSSFYMDTNLVSSNLWASVYSYAANHGYSFDDVGAATAANQPVQMVNWYDCVKWCNARSRQAGLTPVYYMDAGLTQVYTNGDVAPYVNWGAGGYRLPTEAEWEKAARGGLSGQRFPWGPGLSISESQANYYGETNEYPYDSGPDGYNSIGLLGGFPYTSPVGSFAPNGYGLYDMAGNVLEWCWDWEGTPYGQPTTTNPTGPASGGNRILRGGDWAASAYLARCADRRYVVPSEVSNGIGFRCVMRF